MDYNDTIKLSKIYMPLIKEYTKQYMKNNPLTNGEGEYESTEFTEFSHDKFRYAINKAYVDGLYEGINNGFIEGFVKCAEYFDIMNEYFINKSDK